MNVRLVVLLGMLVAAVACNRTYDLPPELAASDFKAKQIPPYPQVSGGDPDSGFYYLTQGAYLGTGLPYEMMRKRLERDSQKLLKQTKLPSTYSYAVFQAENGTKVMNGTCFSCHAGKVLDQTVLGMGNSLNNNQVNLTVPAKLMDWNVRRKFKKDSTTLAAYDVFGQNFKGMAPYTHTDNPGVSSAARIAESCMRYRDPTTLEMTDSAFYDVRDYNLASDIPALWHMQKKNALYYTGVGRGDFTKLLFQASVLGIPDSTAARRAQEKFVHVVEYINSLEPPQYPGTVDAEQAARGKRIFEKNCSGCHGTYGEREEYPNKVIALEKIGTDPLYARYAADSKIVDWYNQSWFATSAPHSWFEPEPGYIAPPLDGIWATAPYFHNGSVPTVAQVLNSKSRPENWKRSRDPMDYDHERLGWLYKDKNGGGGRLTYDTTLPGYGNGGHAFGDDLSEVQRTAVVEYLKTL